MKRSSLYSLTSILLVLLIGLMDMPVVKPESEAKDDGATDYCELSCKKGEDVVKHVACGKDRKFTDKCPTRAHRVSLKKFKTLILKIHNELRNEIAGGSGIFKPAVRMATMVWDNELTDLALANLMDCEMKLDGCRRTARFRYSGQNIAKLGFTKGDLTTEDIIGKLTQLWIKERRNVTMAIIRKFPPKDKVPPIGHFTAMIAQNNTHVGCAAVQYKGEELFELVLTCNYATTNIVGKQVYRAGKKGGSACKTGNSKIYDNLCSFDEEYDNASE